MLDSIHLVQALLLAIAARQAVPEPPAPPLVPKGAVELSGVEGRIDHLAVDLARERVYVAALGNDSVEVVDLKTATRLHSIRGPREPQGIVYLADRDQVVVASGGAGTCDVYDASTLEPVTRLAVGDDADNLRYDPRLERLYVGYGGSIGIVDVELWEVVDRIPLDGHPEGFQIDADDGRVFVNVPGAHEVAVIGLAGHEVLARWKIDEARANFPMALVPTGAAPEGGLVLLGCRTPARLLLRSAATGGALGAPELSGDCDDLFHDAPRQRVYAICGEGFVDVFDGKRGAFEREARVATARGARTGLFVPERSELLVAVPHRGAQPAEIRIFGVRD